MGNEVVNHGMDAVAFAELMVQMNYRVRKPLADPFSSLDPTIPCPYDRDALSEPSVAAVRAPHDDNADHPLPRLQYGVDGGEANT